jgi:hypothetical protein
LSIQRTEAQAEAVGRRLAERIERFSAKQYGLPRTCCLPRCRRTGQCCGAPLACRAELKAAAAARRAAAPADDAWDGLALVRQALLIAAAQKEAEAAAGPNEDGTRGTVTPQGAAPGRGGPRRRARQK